MCRAVTGTLLCVGLVPQAQTGYDIGLPEIRPLTPKDTSLAAQMPAAGLRLKSSTSDSEPPITHC